MADNITLSGASIRKRAYWIWESSGKHEGCSDANWLQAQDDLQIEIDREITLGRDLDRELKRAELAEKSNLFRSIFGPLAPILMTGLIGFVVSQATSLHEAKNTLALEDKKEKSSLFLKAISTDRPEIAARNLLFLLSINAIDDPTGKIAALQHNPNSAPYLPSATGSGLVPITPSATADFFDKWRVVFGNPSATTFLNLTKIFQYIQQDNSFSSTPQIAYVLATIHYETAGSFSPLAEKCNTPCDLPYYPWIGRGYISLTWKSNYQRASDLLGLTGTADDLVINPERALDPQIAYRVVALVLKAGFATGHKLSDFINDQHTDFVNARLTINGTDHAQEVASYAERYNRILKETLPKSQSPK